MKRILIHSFVSAFLIAIPAMLPEVSRGSSQVLGWNASGPAGDLPAGLTNVVALAAGDSHTLALKADGTVIAWGDDSWAQSDVPLGLSDVVAVAAGSSHSLALKANGTVVGWGAGLTNLQSWPDFGQSTAPLGLSNVVAIAASGVCSMALRNDGSVSVWGDNSSGQCNVPVGLTNVVAIALGQYNSLAALGDGSLVAWGNTTVYGAQQGPSYVPPTLTGVVAVAGGYHHSLALKSNGTVVAMGSYGNGWYGFIQATVPAGISNVVAISATGDIDLALTRDGKVFAWGRGGLQDTPAEVTNAVAIANGLNTYNLALIGDGLPFLGPPIVSRTVAYGGSASFRAMGTGRWPLSYSWAFDGVDVPGATNPVFSLNKVTYAATGNYSVTISNVFGKTHGSAAALSVAPLLIASQPQDRSVFLGGEAGFEVSAVAQGPFNYQWQFNGAALPGTDSNSLLLTNLQLNQSGQYGVLVSNSLGQVQSRKARLDVGLVAVWGDDGQGQTNPPVGLSDAVAIAAGDSHNVALKSDGTVRAWGDNYAGQTNAPSGLSNVVMIAAGGSRTLALRSDGTVVAWGDNETAGTNIPAGLINVGAIAAGVTHNLALKQDGTVVAWGDNTYGQIDIPEGLSNVIAVAAGEYHSLALKVDGTVIAWGAGHTNSGYWPEMGQAMVPQTLTNVVAVAAGYFHSLALTADGRVVAWGNNADGETNVPENLANCVAIAGGSSQSLAVQLDGTVVAWGANGSAQTNLPTGLANAVAVAAGSVTSMALIGNGAPSLGPVPIDTVVASGETAFLRVAALGSLPRTYQWQFNGTNLMGATNAVLELDSIQSAQAGIYSVIISNSFGHIVSSGTHLGVAPLLLVEQPQDQSILSGSITTFEVTAAGKGVLTYQWRFNGSDLLGATNAILILTNVQTSQAGSYDVLVSNGIQSIRSVPAELSVDLVAEWNNYNPPTVPPDGLTNVIAISQSDTHSLALNADGTVICWGNNFAGQLDIPAGLTNITAIAAGGLHSLALKKDGTVVAWGSRGYDSGSTNIPAGLNNVVAIAAGSEQSLALKADGTVVSWGTFYNSGSQVQTNPPAGLTNVVAIACGLDHDLALRANGTVVAWGDNYAGQTTVPANVSNVIAVAGGTSHSLALRANGSVQAWGGNYQATNIPGTFNSLSAIAANDNSSIGLRMNGLIVQTAGAPSLPPGLAGVSSISAAGQYTLALIGSGPPVLTGPLPDRTVPYGVTSSIKATANGSPPMHYQWQFNGSDLPGATTALLILPNVTYAQGGSYSLTVSNSLGQVTSRNMILGIVPLDIVIPPSDQSTFVGGSAVFSVTAVGEGPLNYQWRLNGIPLDGGTNRTLILNNLQWNQAGSYSVIISNNATSITSKAVNLALGIVAAWGDNGAGQTNIPPGLTNVIGIACSSGQSLALNSDGTVVAWGADYPTVPTGLTNVVAITAGGNYALALQNDGTVTGWGGGGGAVVPPGLNRVVSIAGGGTHALALRSDGTVVAWGDNTYGQTNVPAGLANVVAVAAGYQNSLALTADGNIIGWGDNSNGQLNFPSSATNVVAIAAGDWHGLALRADRTMIGWGLNSAAYPSSVAFNVKEIAAGSQHTIELTPAGSILSWGDNSFRQLSVPVGLHGVADIAAGGNHNLALIGYGPPRLTSPLVNRTVASETTVNLSVEAVGAGPLSYQWQFNGTNLDGATNAILQLSSISLNQAGHYSVMVSNTLGRVTSSDMQMDVASLVIASQPQDISTFPGANVSFSVTPKGTSPFIYQWQFNGQALAQATNSTLVLSNVLFSQSGAYSVLVSNSLTWIQSRDADLSLSRIVAWGNNYNGQTNVPSGLTNVVAVAAGSSHFLALNADGTVIGWGADDAQQIDVPSDLSGVVAIAAGMSRSIALKADGTVTAWGDYGSARNNVPFDLSDVVAVACGDYHTLALKSDGTIVTWGDDSYGQSSGPITATNVVAIAAGSYHSVALRADGTVLTWGSYYDYSTGIYRVLTAPAGLSSVLNISSCSSAAMAIRSNRTVAAWGDNAFLERAIPALAIKVVALAGGGFSCAALRADGTVVAWGDNNYLETKVPTGLKNATAIAAGQGAFVALIGDGPPVTSAPELNPSLSENGFTLTIPSQSGHVYALEFAQSLNNISWTSLPLVAGNGASITLTDPNPAGSQRYYRVRRW
jgi:alpha-tubulin suppressor-like RCC1 family protein